MLTRLVIGCATMALAGGLAVAPASAAVSPAATMVFIGDADGVSPGQAISNAKADARAQADAAGATNCHQISQHVGRDRDLPDLWEAVVEISCQV